MHFKDIRNYKSINIKDISKELLFNDEICLKASGKCISIKIDKQKTGFGYKLFFICPICNKRRITLYLVNKHIICRECGPLGYKICQLYPKGIDAVYYKMNSIFKRLKVSEYGEKIMILGILHGYHEESEDARGLMIKPKGMRSETLEKLLSDLWTLERKRMSYFTNIFSDIKRCLEGKG